MISVSGLAKRYEAERRSVAAVRGVDFEVADGEVFVLLGPSGCGKSTTLRCIAGLEQPDEGDIAIDGALVSSSRKGLFAPPEARRVAMVFQSHAVWPHMTALENVTFPLVDGVRPLPKARALDLARKALELVQLDGVENRPATQLSGGQQQRVALARALALEPKVLLMDEPLSNLDAALRERMRDELRRLFSELGLTVVYVTHDQTEALSLATRIAVMSEARLLQVGPPEDVYEHPATLEVMTFLGHTNVLDPTAATTLGLAPTSAKIAIRPEDIRLSVQGLEATVQARTFLGDHVLLEVTVAGTPLKLKAPRRTDAHAGARVHITIDHWQVLP